MINKTSAKVMTNAEYHQHPAISKSDLDLIQRSPAYYRYCKAHEKTQTPAMLLGSVVHKLILESADFDTEFVVAPSCDKRTKAGKEMWAEFEMKAQGLTVITQDMSEQAKVMADAVKQHPIAGKLLQNGQAEQSFFWDEQEISCKCRPDYLRHDGIVLDLKTTLNASPEFFTKHSYDFRYHVQAWWYLHGLQQNGIDAQDFVFIAVEKEPPYSVCVFAADDMMFQLGEQEARKNLAVYKDCTQSGIWYDYEKMPEIHNLSLPDWVVRRMSYE